MYVEDFEAFYQQALELYKARPLQTRYCIKYRSCEGKLVLKVTDDIKCLKFKTDQQTDLKRLERMTSIFFPLMATGDVPPEPTPEAAAATAAAAQQQQKQQQHGPSRKGQGRRG